MYHCNLICVSTHMECMEVCDVQKFYTFTTVETYFFVPEPLRNSEPKVIKLQNRLFLL